MACKTIDAISRKSPDIKPKETTKEQPSVTYLDRTRKNCRQTETLKIASDKILQTITRTQANNTSLTFKTPNSSQAHLKKNLMNISKQKLKSKERIGSIGWGVDDAEFQQTFKHQINCLPVKDQHFKFEAEQEKSKLFMFTTGSFASHVDNMYKITYEELENLSIRKQKEVIFARASERKKQRLRHKF